MAIIPDFTQLTDLATGDWLTGWDLSESEMFKISMDDFAQNAMSGYYQPLDADLTTLAGLDKTAGNIIISSGSDWAVENVGSITRANTNINITSRGVYVFYGSVARTWTIADSIVGPVEIRTIATADLTMSGNVPGLGIIGAGSQVFIYRWDATAGQYTF